MNITIRDFNLNDIEILSNYYFQIDKQHFKLSSNLLKNPQENMRELDFFEEIISSPKKGILVAECEEIVGFLEYDIRQRDKKFFKIINTFYVCAIFVHEKYRGKGIGTKLFNKSCDVANSMNVPSIELVVYPSNQKGLSFFEKQKLKETRRIFNFELSGDKNDLI